ncbi:hypothetical protein B0J11DRAFT_87998 [Dendryphion nanum]|uniref:Uncharacterized protein n=1 Tax=Dendryphion nanum TaxID=256645 RepID=A0A9P9IF77_9PLEO|nr:hypothetical protein B0J11DRAFT_87998 [Dendryphion nanum]
MSNKDRVFIAIYRHPHDSELTSLSSRPKAQRYQWGIWVEPKNSTGQGTSFDLEDSAAFSSVANPFGWRLHIDDHKYLPTRMLGRIMIGKMPEGTNGSDVAEILKAVPLPSDPGSIIEDGVAWIRAAIEELQDMGGAESFSVDTFIDDALGHAVSWQKNSKGPEKVNYTWSRTFP